MMVFGGWPQPELLPLVDQAAGFMRLDARGNRGLTERGAQLMNW